MKCLKKQLGLYHPEVDDVFEGQYFSQALMIMDMQPGFFDKSDRVWDEGRLKIQKEKLVNNVCNRTQQILEENGIVFLVEYENYGQTFENITKILNRFPEQTIYLEKRENELTSRRNRCKQKTYRSIKLMKETRIPLELSGINTSACIKESGIGLSQKGIDINITLGTTLDCYYPGSTVESIIGVYGNHSDLINFGDKPKDLRFLSDYL